MALVGQLVVDCALPLQEQDASILVFVSGNVLPVREMWWGELVSKADPKEWAGLRFEGAMMVSGNVYYSFTENGDRRATGWTKLRDVEDECSWYCEDKLAG